MQWMNAISYTALRLCYMLQVKLSIDDARFCDTSDDPGEATSDVQAIIAVCVRNQNWSSP
jgi:hypothetical protein